MAQTIRLKRSATQGASGIPTTSQLELGEVAINTYTGKMYIKKNDGSDSIVEIGGSSGESSDVSTHTTYEYVATSNQTTFSGSDVYSATLAYDTGTPAKIQVFLNGILLDEGSGADYTATNGTSVVLTAGATTGDLVQISAYKASAGTVYTIDTQANIVGSTVTTASTAVTTVNSFAASEFRSARYTVQITNLTDSTYQTTEIILIHNGTTPEITEYGTISTGAAVEATFDADISSGNVRLRATPASSDTMVFKVVRTALTVDNQANISGNTVTTTSTAAATANSFGASEFRSARYTVQITNLTDSTYQTTEIILIHNGTTPEITEYGTVFTGAAVEATFDADISSGSVRLRVTPASGDTRVFKVVRYSITV